MSLPDAYLGLLLRDELVLLSSLASAKALPSLETASILSLPGSALSQPPNHLGLVRTACCLPRRCIEV